MTEMTESEVRVHSRASFRCLAKLAVDDQAPVEAWTYDISLGGISLLLKQAINPGQYCVVKFDAEINGNVQSFSAIAKSIYSVSSNSGEYRTGFQFHQLNSANTEIIHQLAA